MIKGKKEIKSKIIEDNNKMKERERKLNKLG
jgi:hypothetical protein